MMIIDDGRQCCRIDFVADVPLRSPDQAGVGQPLRTFCYPPQAQIGGIGQYGGHQGWPILGRLTTAHVCETITKTCPYRNFGEQIGDADARQ